MNSSFVDVSVETSHSPKLRHHLDQGQAWLRASSEGLHTSAISYAALELRFCIERLGFHYWRELLGEQLEVGDLASIGSFKKIKNRIYALAGQQQRINRHFALSRLLLGRLKVDLHLQTPDIGELSKFWHACSECCHIGWPLLSIDLDIRKTTYQELTAIAKSLASYVASLGWPKLSDPEFLQLRDRYIAGEIVDEQIIEYFNRVGLWAVATSANGTQAQFVGEAVPPGI